MATPDAMDDLWEEMEALEVGGEGIGRGSGGGSGVDYLAPGEVFITKKLICSWYQF